MNTPSVELGCLASGLVVGERGDAIQGIDLLDGTTRRVERERIASATRVDQGNLAPCVVVDGGGEVAQGVFGGDEAARVVVGARGYVPESVDD